MTGSRVVVVPLPRPDDVDAVLAALRRLVRDGTAVRDVRWAVDGAAQASLFDDGGDQAWAPATADHAPAPWPDGFDELARTVALHDDESRFALLHTLARRLAADRRAWADRLDPDRVRAERLAQQVRREIHKMHAFVRFRPVRDEAGGPDTLLAWFEPAHHVVRAAAPFFMKRFAAHPWAITTPRGGVRWDRRALHFTDGTALPAPPLPDDGDRLWLAYYRSIFNPARVKVAMMKREMPVRFWSRLPEATAIGQMVGAAAARERDMIDAPPGDRHRPPSRVCGGDRPADTVTLAAALSRCDRCAFAEHATQAVPGEGPVGATLMLVGEQPGDREDLEGRPFVGPAGSMLRQAMRQLGWPVERVYLTNAVKHFKYTWRGKRRLHKTAAQREAEACADWLEAEIATVKPQALLALGATAARSLLGQDVPVLAAESEGTVFRRADGLPVFVARHPSALLRTDDGRRDAAHAQWLHHLDRCTPLFDAGLPSTPEATLPQGGTRHGKDLGDATT